MSFHFYEMLQRILVVLALHKVCSLLEEVGLGIKDLGMFNESLVAKWRWNLVHTKDSL